jgi:hypothetical protein
VASAGLDEITPTLIGDFALGSAAMLFAWPFAFLMTVAGALLLHLLVFAKPVLPLAGAIAGGLAALVFRRP